MKRCVKRYLNVGLVGLCLLSLSLWAADKGEVVNKADIEFTSLINGDNHMDIVISSGSGGGCSSGQYWDIGVGRCTTAVTLRTESTSRSCSCSCPEAGSCTSSQSGTYPVFGWRLPTAGNELISGYGATSWGSCQMVSNACVAGDTSPPGGGGDGTPPAPGTTFIIDAFICNSGHADWGSGPLGADDKSSIISTYRQFNYGSRCPELGGYVYWQSSWLGWANEYQTSNPGTSLDLALARTWLYPTKQAMNQAAVENNESSASYASVLNQMCADYALRKYGMVVNATYINFSGSSCIVN